MRAPVDFIASPPFPTGVRWVNAAMLRMDQQRGHPVLIEFWDFCRPNSIRTLPYLKAWHARYADAGLRVVGVHASGFAPSADADNVADAVARLGIEYPVMIDADFILWQEYENLGWPARYLWNQDGMLFEYHYGEGAYAETERAIRELLGADPNVGEPGDPNDPEEPVNPADPAHPDELVAPVRPEDVEGALLVPQTEDVEGAYAGPYEAGGVWGVFDGAGSIRVNGVDVSVDYPGAHELIHHEVSTAGTLELQVSDGLTCLATCFTPGLSPG